MSFDLAITNGDIKIRSDGTLTPIFNENKLIQDMLKAIFTPTGSHQLHPWYGSPLLKNTIGTALENEIIETVISNGVFYALTNLMTLQELQQNDGQFLTPREALKTIDNVNAFQDEVDPRKINIEVFVTTRQNKRIQETFSLQL